MVKKTPSPVEEELRNLVKELQETKEWVDQMKGESVYYQGFSQAILRTIQVIEWRIEEIEKGEVTKMVNTATLGRFTATKDKR